MEGFRARAVRVKRWSEELRSTVEAYDGIA